MSRREDTRKGTADVRRGGEASAATAGASSAASERAYARRRAANTGSTNESIGRPSPWREGRYERAGTPVDQSVNKPSETDRAPHDAVGTQTPPSTGRSNSAIGRPAKNEAPVTRKDYES
jgi:hypothetical protein